MKTGKKILLCILALILIAGIVCATMFVTNKNRIKEYSTYCMDEVRSQLGEYLENVSNFYEGKNSEHNWYLYSGKVSYEGINYDYYCRVSGKDNVEVFIYEDFVSYYDNGAIRERGFYIDGKKAGPWTTYDEEGNIIDIQRFRNGKVVGEPNEDVDDLYKINGEKLLSIYPELRDGFDGNIILGDVLQTNYINGIYTIYYDPYRGIAFKLGEEFDGGLIREVDTDEIGYPIQEIILLVKGEENEENRTGINGFREVYTITAISKENLENFEVTPNFEDKIIGENNDYYFIGEKADTEHYFNLTIFDVEKQTY